MTVFGRKQQGVGLFWVLESAWSLSGEWVEIQGITQGGVLTTELQSAKRSFCSNGNYFSKKKMHKEGCPVILLSLLNSAHVRV